MIVLPAIDLRGGRVVRLREGCADTETVYDDDPAGVARRWVAQGAEWLHVVNLDGALQGGQRTRQTTLPVNLRRLQAIWRAVTGTPIQFGGGIRTLDDIEFALELGATRVVLGTVAVHDPDLVEQAGQRFGPERIAVAIDARAGLVVTHGWLQASEIPAITLGQEMRRRGIRHAIYTDVQRDGLLRGVNVKDTVALAIATGLQVIASGGVATLDDVHHLRQQAEAGIAGVIIGQALYRGVLSLSEAIQAALTVPSPKPLHTSIPAPR